MSEDYEILKQPIGNGTYGFVKKGKRKEEGKDVAIKYIKYESKEELNSFLKEVINIFLNQDRSTI
jgi:serine/threonine protein kinase